VGVRLIFENSTAYRKSVPTDLSPFFLFAEVGHHLVHYEIDCFASSCVPGFIRRPFWVVVFPFVDLGISSSGGVLRFIWHSMESLILAQDERWRRA
jgi:hypothetical protein